MSSAVSEAAALRAIVFRISSTPELQLPQQVPAISARLSACQTMLATADARSSGSASSADDAVVVHKFRTQLSTLLQSRSVHGRWAGIVLVKTAVGVGGYETLQKSLPWVRGLLGMLNKPDPPSVKDLCIVALTRIFMLTWEYPTLIRDITTPSLPALITSCLQLATSKKATCLQTVLDSFGRLLPRHPTTFRTHSAQIRQLLVHIVAPTPSNKLSPEQAPGPRTLLNSQIAERARRLYTHLPRCAPKGAVVEQWEAGLRNAVRAAHRTADRVFRAVVGDWQPSAGQNATSSTGIMDHEVQDLNDGVMGLPAWSGVHAGAERLAGLLRLATAHLSTSTASPVNVRLGLVADLLARTFSLTIPVTGDGAQQNAKSNPEVSKQEREQLWEALPAVHVAAMEVLCAMVDRFGEALLPLIYPILEQLSWVWQAEQELEDIRAASYLTHGRLLKLCGSTLPKSSMDLFTGIIRSCCRDQFPQIRLEPDNSPAVQKNAKEAARRPSMHADKFLNSSSASTMPTAQFRGLHEAATDLLPILLSCLPSQHVSTALRTQLDRTAVLTGHKEAMLASVLNPPPSVWSGQPAASILPLLARSHPNASDVEALLRPRMPVVSTGLRAVEGDVAVSESVASDGELAERSMDQEDNSAVDARSQRLEQTLDVQEAISRSTVAEPKHDMDAVIAGHPDLPVDNASPSAGAPSPDERVPSSLGSKRPQDEDMRPSPSKRARLVEGEGSTGTSVALTAKTGGPEDLVVSSDGESFGQLVLGQDSEDESVT